MLSRRRKRGMTTLRVGKKRNKVMREFMSVPLFPSTPNQHTRDIERVSRKAQDSTNSKYWIWTDTQTVSVRIEKVNSNDFSFAFTVSVLFYFLIHIFCVFQILI